MILLDTDHLTILTNARARAHKTLLARIDAADSEIIGIPIVAAEEQCRGWLAQIARQKILEKQLAAYENFTLLLEFLGNWQIARFDARAAFEFASFRKQVRRVGPRDLKIAAIAVTNDALLLSSNLRDFRQVPGLNVEDWLNEEF